MGDVNSWCISFVCDITTDVHLQRESSIDTGTPVSQYFSDGPATSRYSSCGTSLQDTSDGLGSSRHSCVDQELFELQCYNKELEQKNMKLEAQCAMLTYVFYLCNIPLVPHSD